MHRYGESVNINQIRHYKTVKREDNDIEMEYDEHNMCRTKCKLMLRMITDRANGICMY